MSLSALATLLALLALAVTLAALASLQARTKQHELVMDRLKDLASEKEAKGQRHTAQNTLERRFVDLCWRAGITPAVWHFRALIGATALLAPLGFLLQGVAGLLLLPLLFLAVVYLILARRATQRRRLMIAQLPTFIDHLIRAVTTGNTLDTSIVVATAEAQEPLRSAFQRVVREIHLGGSLEEALEQNARTYDMLEMRVLKLAVAVNRRYGSSIQELLKNIVTMIRRAEAARREFHALTSETRLSAWVLGVMPIAIAAYIMFMSPQYIGTMWNDPTGRIVLWTALGLQTAGAYILWRMTKAF